LVIVSWLRDILCWSMSFSRSSTTSGVRGQGRIFFLLLVLLPVIPLAYLVVRSIAGEREDSGVRIASCLEGAASDVNRRLLDSFRSCEGELGRRLEKGELSKEELIRLAAERSSVCPLVSDYFILDSGLRLLYPFGFDGEEIVDPADLARSPGGADRCLQSLLKGSNREYAVQDLAGALEEYRAALAAAEDGRCRALSLNALARCLNRLGKYEDAQTYYREMLSRGGANLRVGGLSLDLLARYQSAILEELIRGKGAAVESLLPILRDLSQGRLAAGVEEADFYVGRIEEVLAGFPGPNGFDREAKEYLNAFRRRSASARRIEDLIVRRHGEFKAFLEDPRRGGGPEGLGTSDENGGEIVICRRMKFSREAGWALLVALCDRERLRAEIASALQAAAQAERDVLFSVADASGRPAARAGGEGEASRFRLRSSLAPLLPAWRLDFAYRADGILLAVAAREKTIRLGYIALLLILIFLGLFMVVRLARKDQEVAKLKSDFVSRVSHELRTPLATIRAVGEMLEMGAAAGPDKEREYYGIITSETERLSRLIDNVLDFSSIDARRKRYNFAPLDLSRTVAETVKTFREYARNEGYEVDFEAVPVPSVLADADAIRQALINLMDNALKFSPEEKTIRVRLSCRGDEVRLSVSDRGIGIDQRDFQRIFQQFYRLQEARALSRKGAGLGLAIVKHIAEAHGGRVEVESKPGEGSTFTIVFPRAKT